eukprot:5221175-Prymnesium_polylepis.3
MLPRFSSPIDLPSRPRSTPACTAASSWLSNAASMSMKKSTTPSSVLQPTLSSTLIPSLYGPLSWPSLDTTTSYLQQPCITAAAGSPAAHSPAASIVFSSSFCPLTKQPVTRLPAILAPSPLLRLPTKFLIMTSAARRLARAPPSAPASSSRCTASVWPDSAATYSAVRPASSRTSTPLCLDATAIGASCSLAHSGSASSASFNSFALPSLAASCSSVPRARLARGAVSSVCRLLPTCSSALPCSAFARTTRHRSASRATRRASPSNASTRKSHTCAVRVSEAVSPLQLVVS